MVTGRIHSLESFGTVDGPGIRFVVFMQGCPLRCLYCHNPDTWPVAGACRYTLTPGELLAETLKYRNFIARGGVTATGGEPLLQPEFLKHYFALCRQEGLHTALDTSGAICSPKTLEVLDHTDLVLLDIKTMDPALHPVLTGVGQEAPLAFLDALQARHIPVWIRHVLVPGLTDDPRWLEALGQHIDRYSVVQKIELLPYHTLGAYKYDQLALDYPLSGRRALTAEELEQAKTILGKYRPCH